MKRPNARRAFVFAGAFIVATATVWLILWQVGIGMADKRAEQYLDTIRELIPEPQDAALEERRDNTMPTLSVDGVDFVGILEMSLYDFEAPVCAEWGSVSKYPCRFSGSVYDKTMRIGATSQGGQIDFYREISVGDRVTFTDMAGNRYTYTVSDLRYEKHTDGEVLARGDAALTVFIKNTYDFEYLIVYCDTLSE